MAMPEDLNESALRIRFFGGASAIIGRRELCTYPSFRGGVASLMLAAFLAVGSCAVAETVSFRADLKGASEVPPTDRKGIGTVSVSPRLG
jgi:hypothetical protein